MMPPKIYRTTVNGYVFETPEEALQQSISDAAETLFFLLKDKDKPDTKSTSAIVGEMQEIQKAMKELNKSFRGESYSEYKSVSL